VSNTLRVLLADEVGEIAADVLIQRLLMIRTLKEVGETVGMSPAQVRQKEAAAIRTMSPHAFAALTVAAQSARPAFAWHDSVTRQRGK
jgi:DNA-directed RNA polymerase sigma subunit (sigma70/sigma32)